MTQISQLSILNFKSGAIIDRLERALSETINHIADPETGLEAREICLSIKIKPSDDRDEAEIIVKCETKLKNPTISESISIDWDLNGKPVAYEVMRQSALPIAIGNACIIGSGHITGTKSQFKSNQI